MTLQLRYRPHASGPHYILTEGTRIVADVWRVQDRWHAVIRADAKAERPDWQPVGARATRDAAVAAFTAAWEALA